MKNIAVVAALLFAASAIAQNNLPDPAPLDPKQPAPPPALAPEKKPTPAPEVKPELKAEPKVELREVPAPPAAALPSREAADALKEDELEQIVGLLRDNYIRPESLTDGALARAGVQGLLDRLGAGARIFPKAAAAPAPTSPFRSERLEGGTAYIRLGTLGIGNLAALDKAFDDFGSKPPAALVLDLRATPPSTDFEMAAEVCRRFAPRGRILFSIKRPKVNDEEILTSREDPRWRGLLVVLVDGDTAGSAEIVAAVLRTHLRAYIVGQQTRGEAAQFEDIALGKDKILRVAIGEVTLPDASPVFPGGVAPDLLLAIPQEQTNALLTAALESGVAPLITEKVRPRLSEAALVAGTNPELDAMKELQELRAKGLEPKPPLRDAALQRALDYVATVGIFEAAQKRKP